MTKKNKRISKKTNRKINFLTFIESEYTDLKALKKACKDDENLMIYTCLSNEELEEVIVELKQIETFEDKITYLVNNQPTMNSTLERFNKCVESIATYLKGYIEYNGFRMANADGDYEDWTSEFWLKYTKICDFYRTRWFFPEKLKKESTVVYSPILYKEFIYVCRMSITGERKHQAFLATQNQNSTIFKVSLDNKVSSNEDDDSRTILETVSADNDLSVFMLDQANLNNVVDKALVLCKQYAESEKYYDQIKDFYIKQDLASTNKKVVILAKIFLYKAGLVSYKTLMFIKNLSPTYKSRYNISQSRVLTQLEDFKNRKRTKAKSNTPIQSDWRSLVFMKRGEL